MTNKRTVEKKVFAAPQVTEPAVEAETIVIPAVETSNVETNNNDSMEDMLMANKATEMGIKTTFCGIYGSGKLPDMKKKIFVKYNVPLILESIYQLPDS